MSRSSPKSLFISKALRNKKILIGISALISVFLVTLFAPLLTPFSIGDADITQRLASPSSTHWLGCDLSGADVLMSILYGGRLSLYIAFLTVIISFVVGVTIGICTGYFGGVIDTIFMRIVDITMAFPGILLALALLAVIGPNVHSIIFAISITGWTASARIARAQTLSLKTREYVLAGQVIGVSTPKILVKHVLPGILPALLIHATFSTSGVIIVESSLSFLGLGPQGEISTWGGLLSQGRQYIESAPHLSVAPGIAIMLTVLGLNYLGDGLRDVLDPKFDA